VCGATDRAHGELPSDHQPDTYKPIRRRSGFKKGPPRYPSSLHVLRPAPAKAGEGGGGTPPSSARVSVP
jgi:hypothetical protein